MNGYRIAPQFRERYREQQYIGKGASIIKIYDAPSDSEETFFEWWDQEVKNAQRDGVIIIVMKDLLNECSYRSWSKNGLKATCWRRTSLHRSNSGQIYYNVESQLTDEWGDEIPKPVRQTDKDSDSEAELEDEKL